MEPQKGDIVLFNYDGPVGEWKHAGIVVSETTIIKQNISKFLVAECNDICCFQFHYIYNDYEKTIDDEIKYYEEIIQNYNKIQEPKEYKDYKKGKKEFKKLKKRIKNQKIKLIRWKGPIHHIYEICRMTKIYENDIKYIKAKHWYKFTKTLLSCYVIPKNQKKKDKYFKHIKKYVISNESKDLPKISNKNITVFCSQYVSGLWTGTLGTTSYILDAFPIIPERCLPSDLAKLSDKFPDWWDSFEIKYVN